MHYCDFCGEEILGTPYRRRRHHYCSRTCADDHEFELAERDADEDMELEVEGEEDEY